MAMPEVRPTDHPKRFAVYENGAPIKDAKGADKWFSTQEKAQAYLAKRTSGAKGTPHAEARSISPRRPVTSTAKAPKARPAVIGDNGGPSEQALKTAAKLEDVAKRTIERANQVLSQDRKMNTARRIRMGNSVRDDAQQNIADAKTAMKIAEALRNGEAGALSSVSSLADIRELRRLARNAEYETDRKEGRRYKEGGHGLKHEDVANLSQARAYVRVSERDVQEMREALAGKKGVAADLKTLERYARSTVNGERTNYSTTDPAVVKAITNVANTIKKADTLKTQYPHQVKSLKYAASKYIEEVRDYNRKNKLAGGFGLAGQREALKAFLDVRSGKIGINPTLAAEQSLVGMKLPGFFPTPQSLAARMADLADIHPGQRVLEPSAGTGRLADAVKAKGANVETVEMQSRLRDILQKKGHTLVASDFTEMEAKPNYDRIVMNPPFEKGQDIAHVRRAFDMLKPGGKMVAIMGEGAFFRGDKQASEFRDWLSGVGSSERLPEGTFKESNTGVNSRLVTIMKPGSAGEHHVWDEKAHAASAEVRSAMAAAKPSSALERAMATSEQRAATMESTLGLPSDATATNTEHRPSQMGLLEDQKPMAKKTTKRAAKSVDIPFDDPAMVALRDAKARASEAHSSAYEAMKSNTSFLGSMADLSTFGTLSDDEDAAHRAAERADSEVKQAERAVEMRRQELQAAADNSKSPINKLKGMSKADVAKVYEKHTGITPTKSTSKTSLIAKLNGGVIENARFQNKLTAAHLTDTPVDGRAQEEARLNEAIKAVTKPADHLVMGNDIPKNLRGFGKTPKPSSGVRGTQNAANLEAINANKKAKAASKSELISQLKKIDPSAANLSKMTKAELQDRVANNNHRSTGSILDGSRYGGEGPVSIPPVKAKTRGGTEGALSPAYADRERRYINRMKAGDTTKTDAELKADFAEKSAKGARVGKLGKAVGLLAPIAIGAAMLLSAKQAKAEGRNPVHEALKTGAQGAGTMAAFSAAQGAGTWALIKGAGMTAAKAIPAVNAAMMVGNAAFEAYNAPKGHKIEAAAKGAWDMSLPGMIANTARMVNSLLPETHNIGGRGAARGPRPDFNTANQAFRQRKAPPVASTLPVMSQNADKKKGWSNSARISAYLAKNPSGANLPYGGDRGISPTMKKAA